MKNKFFTITVIFIYLSLANIGLVLAVDDKPLEIDRPERYKIPGRLVAEGTKFELNNSEYLNITAVSLEPVKIVLGSVLERVTMHIEPLNDDASTQMTLGGFVPQTTYHKYEDNHLNVTTFTTDTKGTYTYVQDLSKPHFVSIQPVLDSDYITEGPVIYINDNVTGGDCTCIGNWDPNTKTCTLTTDFNGSILIDSDNITLDGNGHTLIGNDTNSGVSPYYDPQSANEDERKDIIIKNLIIRKYETGISMGYGIFNILINNNTILDSREGIYYYGIPSPYQDPDIIIINNNISYNNDGIRMDKGHNTTITGNTFLNNENGIHLDFDTKKNCINENIISSNNRGIWLSSCYHNVVSNNTIFNNNYGICDLPMTFNNTIIGNDIFNNEEYGIYIYHDSGGSTVIGNNIRNSTKGIYIGGMTSNNIIGNNIFNNEYGIDLDIEDSSGSEYINNITQNNILNNNYGIYGHCNIGTTIYQNNLENNIDYNAYELDNSEIQWDNGTIGNHWSDYDEPCEGCFDNGYGICEKPYSVPISSGIDNFPLISWGTPVSTVSFNASNYNLPLNSLQIINLTLDSAPNGLSGYNITISLSNPTIAEIISVEFPDWAALNSNSSLPGDSGWLRAADINSQIEMGASNVSLASLTIRGDSHGSTHVIINVTSMDDDNGNMINPETVQSQLEVIGVIPFPGCIMPPIDPDSDGLYEDINGNGVIDFNDIVIFFTYLEWVSDNEPVECFDFNGNGRIDFDDVIKLFEES